MTINRVSPEQEALIDDLVQHYVSNRGWYRKFVKALHGQIGDAIDPENGDPLSRLVHSVKFRLKNPVSFKDKLIRKMLKCSERSVAFPYTRENLFSKVGDLAGYRILHLHTRQFGEINHHLVPLLEQSHNIVEGPRAKTWDEETKDYYKSIGIETEDNNRM